MYKSLIIILLNLIINCLLGCQQPSKINGLQFDKINQGTKVRIDIVKINTDEIIIENTNSIEFVKKFIKNYPDDWVKPQLSPIPAPLFWITFYDDGNNLLDSFGVGSDFLVYGPYWKRISIQESKLLIEELNITVGN